MARMAAMTLEEERLFRSPPPPDLTMLPEAAYKARTEKVGRPKISSVEPSRQESHTGNEMPSLGGHLQVRSRVERVKSQTKLPFPGDNSKRKKNDYRQERRKPLPAKPREKEEREGQTSTGDGNKTANGGETGHKNNGIPEPI